MGAHESNLEPGLGCKRPFQFRLRTLLIIMTAFAVLLSMWSTLWLWVDYVEGPISERGFKKIEIGMDLDMVEAILGPGEQIPAGSVTQAPGSPDARRRGNLDLVVDGDQFFRWENAKYGRRIELGIRDGKVCDKFYWEPSL